MKVRRYEDEDFAQIKAWGEQWGVTYNEDQLPKVGFIVDGVAAYFLYQTDSNICWLENMVSKKDADPLAKARALDLLVDAILKEALELGYTMAFATTDNLSVAKRARQNGAAIKINQFLLMKDLTTQPSFSEMKTVKRRQSWKDKAKAARPQRQVQQQPQVKQTAQTRLKEQRLRKREMRLKKQQLKQKDG